MPRTARRAIGRYRSMNPKVRVMRLRKSATILRLSLKYGDFIAWPVVLLKRPLK